MHKQLLDAAKAELRGYLTFTEGWDGYRGKTFTATLIEEACQLAEKFADQMGDKLTDMVPGPASDGSVDVEFRVGERQSLIVTLYDNENPVYFLVNLFQREDDVERTQGTADNVTIQGLVDKLLNTTIITVDNAIFH
jgi:hypothetical protein